MSLYEKVLELIDENGNIDKEKLEKLLERYSKIEQFNVFESLTGGNGYSEWNGTTKELATEIADKNFVKKHVQGEEDSPKAFDLIQTKRKEKMRQEFKEMLKELSYEELTFLCKISEKENCTREFLLKRLEREIFDKKQTLPQSYVIELLCNNELPSQGTYADKNGLQRNQTVQTRQ